jgi:hypothetical protein
LIAQLHVKPHDKRSPAKTSDFDQALVVCIMTERSLFGLAD